MSAKHGARNARIATSRRNRIDEQNAREDILQLVTAAASCKDLLQPLLQPRRLKLQAIATGREMESLKNYQPAENGRRKCAAVLF